MVGEDGDGRPAPESTKNCGGGCCGLRISLAAAELPRMRELVRTQRRSRRNSGWPRLENGGEDRRQWRGGGGARFSASRTNRGRVRSRERGEVRGGERGARSGPYPPAGRLEEVGNARGGASDRAGRYSRRGERRPEGFALSPL